MPIYVEGAKYVKYIYLKLFIVSYIKKFIYLLKEEKKFRGTMAAPRSNQALPLILISTFTVTVSVKRLMIFMSRYQSCPLSTVFGRGSVSFKHVKRIYIFFVLLQIMYSMP